MHTDPLFYRLFQERPALAFDLAGLEAPAAARYRMQAVEVKQTAFRLDGVLTPPPDQDTAPLLFTEAQFQRRPTFYGRWLASIFLYLYRHRIQRPWQAVAIFPDRATDAGSLAPYQGLIDCGLLRQVYLIDLLDAPELGFNARLARLVILDETRAGAEARALAAAHETTEDPAETLDLIETILVYKFPQLTPEDIRAMLHLPETDLKKSRFYQEVFSEGGEEAERKLVMRLLKRRLGRLTDEQESRIQGLASTELGELGEALLEFRAGADLDAWLQG